MGTVMSRVWSDGIHGHIICPHRRRQSRYNLYHPGRVCVPALLVHLVYLLGDLTTKDGKFKSSAYQFVYWPCSGRLVALSCVTDDVGPLCSIFPEAPPLPVGASHYCLGFVQMTRPRPVHNLPATLLTA